MATVLGSLWYVAAGIVAWCLFRIPSLGQAARVEQNAAWRPRLFPPDGSDPGRVVRARYRVARAWVWATEAVAYALAISYLYLVARHLGWLTS